MTLGLARNFVPERGRRAPGPRRLRIRTLLTPALLQTAPCSFAGRAPRRWECLRSRRAGIRGWRCNMTDAWKQCKVQVIENNIPLQQYLGGTDYSAVFLTQPADPPAQKSAIK